MNDTSTKPVITAEEILSEKMLRYFQMKTDDPILAAMLLSNMEKTKLKWLCLIEAMEEYASN
jgi:hypothetical protein